MPIQVRDTPARVARRGARAWRLSLGAVASTLPVLTYPGNWTIHAPSAPNTVAAWTADAVGNFAAMVLGLVWTGWTLVSWPTVRSAAHPRSALANLREVILAGRNRSLLILSGMGYASVFAVFAGVVSFGSAPRGSPEAFVILCCGYPGVTPGLVVEVPPGVQFAVNPLTLLLFLVGAALFAANIAVTVELLRRRSAVRANPTYGVLGAAGTLLVGCPSCGTILAAGALEGTAVAGLLSGWAILQLPLLLSAIPLAAGGLWACGRQLARLATCSRPMDRGVDQDAL